MKGAQSMLAGVVLCTVISACGSSVSTPTPTPTPNNPTPTVQNPTITTFAVSPTFGVSGLTLITMSATASDPANNALTYTWSYGNTTLDGSTTSATLTGDGIIAVQLTVSNGKGGSATRSQNVTIGTMTGTWNLNVDTCGGAGNPGTMTLTQNGTSVTGTLFWATKWCANTPRTGGTLKQPGTIDAQGNFQMLRISVVSGIVGAFLEFQLKGQMDSTGRKIVGVIDQSGFHNDPMTMTKQ